MNKFRRYISIFLCLSLLLFSSFPIRAFAYYFDPFSATAYAVVGNLAADAISEFSKFVASILTSASISAGKAISSDSLKKFTQWGLFIASKGAYKPIVLSKTEEFVEKSQINGSKIVLTPELLSILSSSYYELYGETLVLPEAGLQIYVPPESLWMSGDLISYDRLTSSGFHDLSELNDNILAGNKISWQVLQSLDSIQKFLRTDQYDFFDSNLSDIYSRLSAINNNVVSIVRNLDTYFGSLDDSILAMTSTLHNDLSHLKTLYSTFGNETLSKLDILNTSIQNLESYDSSEDFDDLKYLYSTFGNETLSKLDDLVDSIENIPYTFSDTIAGHFTDLSVRLDQVISKLGDDFSFLEVISQNQDLLLIDLSAYFYNLISTLESLDVTASVELQPLIDHISAFELNLNSFLESLYDLQASYLSSLETTLYNQFDYIASLYLEDYLVAFNNGFALLNETLYEVWSDTSNLVEVKVSLEELVGSDLLTAGTFTDVFERYIGELTSVVDHYGNKIITDVSSEITNLKTDLLVVLNDIKTSIKSIAGTTTADPGAGDDDSQDEANKQKIPLIPYINNGFQQGENYIDNVYMFLADELAAFRVAALIFEEFANISFFYKLIITSCSVGLIGTLLGMALNVQAYSVAQRRREEAAQSRAHVRMERSTAA